MSLPAALTSCLIVATACGSAQTSETTQSKERRPLPSLTTAAPAPVLKKIQTKYMMPLRKCAHAAIALDVKAAGVYQIELQLATDGSTTTLDISGSSKPLRTCIEKLVNTWQFAAQRDKNNKPVTGTYTVPVSFKPPRIAKTNRVVDAHMISVIHKKYLGGVHECHKTALRSDPNAIGKVNLRYTITVDGSVSFASVIGIKNAELLDCIRRKVLTWRLTPPRNAAGKPTTKTVGITVRLDATKTTR